MKFNKLVFLCVLSLLVSSSITVRFLSGSAQESTKSVSAIGPIWSNGYEEGDFSAWSRTQNGPIVQQAVVHSGSWAAKMSMINGGCASLKDDAFLPGPNPCYARCWFYLLNVPTQVGQSAFVMELYNEYGGSEYHPVQAYVVYSSTLGKAVWALHVNWWGSTRVSSIQATTGAWHEVQIKAASGTGNCQMWVDGVLAVADGPECVQNMVSIRIGGESNFRFDFYADDVAVDSKYISDTLYPCNVHLEARQNNSATFNVGTITFDGVQYVLANDVSKIIGSYQAQFNPASGYVFDHWETTGGISVSNASASQTTVAVSSPGGTFRGIYKSAGEAIWSNGYEEGDFRAWSRIQADPIIQQNVVHSGSAAVKISIPRDGTCGTLKDDVVVPGPNPCYARVWVYLLTVPTQAGQWSWVMELYNEYGGSVYHPVQAQVVYSSATGKAMWALHVNWWGSIRVSSIQATTGVWHEIQLKAVSGSGECQMWVDGVLAVSGPECEQKMVSVRIGGDSNFKFDFYADDVVVDDQYIG